MFKKYSLASFMCILVLSCVFLLQPLRAQAKKPVVLRLVIATSEGDWPQTYRDKEMAKRFNERANGEYVIEVYAGGALAKLPEFFDAVRIGAVEMEFSNWGMFTFLEPKLGLLETPFLFNNNYAANAACKKMLPLFDKIFQEKFNAKALAMTNTGGLGLWSQKPIKTLDDWKGLLVGSVSPVTSTLIKGLGGSPVTIPFYEIYESLQKKVVDAAAQSAHGGVVFGFPEVCKYFTAFYGIPAPAGYSINLKVWKKMPPHIQTILLEETQKATEWMSHITVTELPEKDLSVFKEKGVSVYYVPKEEREKWAAQLESYRKEQLSSHGELGKEIERIADEVNKEYPYTEKGIL